MMEYYRITPEELAKAQARSCTAVPEPEAVAPPAVKYRHPATGETWDGRGPHPPWMRQALLRDGYRVEELRV